MYSPITQLISGKKIRPGMPKKIPPRHGADRRTSMIASLGSAGGACSRQGRPGNRSPMPATRRIAGGDETVAEADPLEVVYPGPQQDAQKTKIVPVVQAVRSLTTPMMISSTDNAHRLMTTAVAVMLFCPTHDDDDLACSDIDVPRHQQGMFFSMKARREARHRRPSAEKIRRQRSHLRSAREAAYDGDASIVVSARLVGIHLAQPPW
ncbi:MAG: hypothetical protein R3E68_05275 [Burkholderiaceae bacterium]